MNTGNYPAGVTGNEKAITGESEIEWEFFPDDILDMDIDRHGTRIISATGKQYADGGFYEYEGTATHYYPYEMEPELDENSIECLGFTPNEPEPED